MGIEKGELKTEGELGECGGGEKRDPGQLKPCRGEERGLNLPQINTSTKAGDYIVNDSVSGTHPDGCHFVYCAD